MGFLQEEQWMEQLSKSQVLSVKKADAAADIALINRYSKKELKPGER